MKNNYCNYQTVNFSNFWIALLNFCPRFSYRSYSFVITKVVGKTSLLHFCIVFYWFMVSFLYCFPFIALPTIAIVRRAINDGRVIKKRSKELIPKIKQRRLRAITLQEPIEKNPIMLSQYRRKIDNWIAYFAFWKHQYYFRRL